MAFELPQTTQSTSVLSPIAALFGGGGGGAPAGGLANPLGAIIAALMKGGQGSSGGQSPSPTGTYEGNIQTPANPFNNSTAQFGMQSRPPMPQAGGATQPPAQPPGNPWSGGAGSIPFMTPGGAPSGQSGMQSMPPNPFAGGAPPTPFLNTSALFGRPPIGGSPLSAVAQRPNPISSMQL